MITLVKLTRFRGFERFRCDLSPHAYIVGPNSAGKSTLLEAVGLAEQCLQRARRINPTMSAFHGDQRWKAYPLIQHTDEGDDPVRFDFGTDEAHASIEWSSGGTVHMVWPSSSDDIEAGFFYLEVRERAQPRSLDETRRVFPVTTIVPVVTPLSHIEELRDSKYVRNQANTRLASRHFRNHAFLMDQEGRWDLFKEFCRPWMSEIELMDVGLNIGENRLTVFYTDQGNRVPKELAWAGDGYQIWVQLLWHVFRTEAPSTILLDEPEVYLHPNLQRRLVRLLNTLDAQVILASHSADVIAEAPDGGVLWVDRKQLSGRRVINGQTLSALSETLGYSYNLALAQSMRARLVIGTDCQDTRVLRSLARTLGATNIADEHAVNIVRLQDFSRWSGREDIGNLLNESLPHGIPTVILFGAGLRPPNLNQAVTEALALSGVRAHVWQLPELENYVIDAETLARVSGAAPEVVALRTLEAIESLRAQSRAQHSAEWISVSDANDSQSVLERAERVFDETWSEEGGPLKLVKGSSILDRLNVWLNGDGYKTVTPYVVAHAIGPHALASELFTVLLDLDDQAAYPEFIA